MTMISEHTVHEITDILISELIMPALMKAKAGISSNEVPYGLLSEITDYPVHEFSDELQALLLRVSKLEVLNDTLNNKVLNLETHLKRVQESNKDLKLKVEQFNRVLSESLKNEDSAENFSQSTGSVGGEVKHKEDILNYVTR